MEVSMISQKLLLKPQMEKTNYVNQYQPTSPLDSLRQPIQLGEDAITMKDIGHHYRSIKMRIHL